MDNVSAIDLFCGIGGLSKGLQDSGICVNLGLDLDASCRYAYEKNIDAKFINKNITDDDLTDTIVPYWNDGIKILAGCAPCQPFSTHANKNKNKQESEKWNLINYFLKVVQKTKPDIVTMENVPNLKNQQIFKDFVVALYKEGYDDIWCNNVYCPDYGMAQKRRRLVLLASRLGEIKLIEKTHKKENYTTVRKAIGHLNPIHHGQIDKKDTIHRASFLNELNLKRMQSSKQGGTWKDWNEDIRLECHKKSSGSTYKSVYGRMKENEPSPTITTQFYNYGTGRFGHPNQDRALSIREAAILQSFREDYKFVAKGEKVQMTTLGRHIGNAVPPKLGKVIGKSILEHIESYGKKSKK